ncbi:MAG: integration host factor B [Candidatus Desulfovibrio kirbyi]|jgi:integration host factor subunit beta|uniref:Integration host factor B n=1 Tax=Candidatus Desulfovibrio kirbyi TaxID=2696086 RepID=A0A6L2R3T5_9BACT|nr:MAG: integration host factor B [Candidatus Desulfovibrio kirbyi]
MNKSELIKKLTDETHLPLEEAGTVVNIFYDSMKSSLIDRNRIEIRGFGSFKIKEYCGYTGRNPKTGERIAVAPKCLPFFRAGRDLKEFTNK